MKKIVGFDKELFAIGIFPFGLILLAVSIGYWINYPLFESLHGTQPPEMFIWVVIGTFTGLIAVLVSTILMMISTIENRKNERVDIKNGKFGEE